MAQFFAGAVAFCVLEKATVAIIDKICNEYNRREREKTTKDLESKMSKDFQDLKNKMEALLKDFKELEGSTQNDVQLLRQKVEKIQGKKEKERARVLESRLRKNVRQLSQRIQSLEEDVENWPMTIKYKLQVRREELEKIQGMNVENIALALENMLQKNKRQLSQKIQAIEEDINECLDTMKYELQVFKEELEEKIQGTKEKNLPMVMSSSIELEMWLLLQRIKTHTFGKLKCSEIREHELEIFRKMLEKIQGRKKE
ncbi:leucine zipper protein 1-like isoform X1 [Oenanthe melanoleuca]|uniref:leucine zipper protein 1-like isoform X1 n=1 Tax=Oenanthe melanoleuca TaxID=2939378 RepID=UPI0024C1D6EA|nr:leucine zipper protein 1-like isoform X1 [Oenanthe melanoleuca]